MLCPKQKGFTLIEIVVVLAILAIMAIVVLIAINPVERLRRGRDGRRLSDLNHIQKAIDHYIIGNQNLPVQGEFLRNSGLGSTDSGDPGSNWMRLDLSASLPAISKDPTNYAAISFAEDPVGVQEDFYYYYRCDTASDTYELNCYLESKANASKLTEDGGDDDSAYEIGTNAGLWLIHEPEIEH